MSELLATYHSDSGQKSGFPLAYLQDKIYFILPLIFKFKQSLALLKTQDHKTGSPQPACFAGEGEGDGSSQVMLLSVCL